MRNLLDIASLQKHQVEDLIELGKFYLTAQDERRALPILRGKTIITFFMEPSTRTRISFELAAQRLGAIVVNVATANSSLKKGESLNDTIATLKNMQADGIILRHSEAGAAQFLAHLEYEGIINAGDGAHAHPTQALLDALTLKNYLKELNGRKIAICGDIKHSRVARSDIVLLGALGCHIHLIAPTTLMPDKLPYGSISYFTDMKQGLRDVDALIMLRLQNERMSASLIPSQREYFHYFGLNRTNGAFLRKDAAILHPGPVNKYVEIDPAFIHEKRCLINQQVQAGVAVRMAVLHRIFGSPHHG